MSFLNKIFDKVKEHYAAYKANAPVRELKRKEKQERRDTKAIMKHEREMLRLQRDIQRGQLQAQKEKTRSEILHQQHKQSKYNGGGGLLGGSDNLFGFNSKPAKRESMFGDMKLGKTKGGIF